MWYVIAVVRASDLQSRGPGFDFQPFHFHVTTLSKLFTHTYTHLLSPSSRIYWPKGGDVTLLNEKVAGSVVTVSCEQTRSVSVGILQKNAVSVRFFTAFSNFLHTQLAQFQA